MSTFTSRVGEPPPAGVMRVAVKDLIDMTGWVTTAGSKVLAAINPPATADAACLAGLREAENAGRAAIVGRTNLHELAFGVSGINPWYGTPVNPLDPARVPGGSSSGSAVAVATGEADVAIGSDTGGSIRIPAACCGVAGLKTSRGRVSLKGVQGLAPSLDTVGPMGATVAGVLEGMRLLEPGFQAADRPAARVARFRPPAEGWVDEALDRALERYCDETGAQITDVPLHQAWDRATHAAMTILSSEAWATFCDLWKEHGGELSPDVSRRLELAALLSADEAAEAWEIGRRWARELAAVLSEADVIAMPVLADAPPLLEDASRVTDIRYAAPVNLAGVPSLALPVPAAGEFPASLQLIGTMGAEELVVATGLAVEAAQVGRP